MALPLKKPGLLALVLLVVLAAQGMSPPGAEPHPANVGCTDTRMNSAACTFECADGAEYHLRVVVPALGAVAGVAQCGGAKTRCFGLWLGKCGNKGGPTGHDHIGACGGSSFGSLVTVSCSYDRTLLTSASDDAFGTMSCMVGPVEGRAAAGMPSWQSDFALGGAGDPTGLADTDSGGFEFAGDAMCTALDTARAGGQPEPALEEVVPATIEGMGTFVSLACGTGTANVEARLTSHAFYGGSEIDMTLAIRFVAGAGPASISVLGGHAGLDAADGSHTGNDIDSGSGQGIFQLLPTAGGGNCVNEDVTDFLMNGSFYVVVSGDGQS